MPAPQPASPFDPIDRLDPGEDHFLIREKDPVGSQAITAWAAARRLYAIKLYGADPNLSGDARRLRDAEFAQARDADEKAGDWVARRQGHETPAEERATYAGAQMSEEQVAQAKRKKHHDELLRNLREAAYHAAEIIALDGAEADTDLVLYHARINELANALQYGGRAEAA